MPFSEHFAETCITRRVVINVPQLQYKHSGGSLFHAQSADFWQDHHCWGKECCVYYFLFNPPLLFHTQTLILPRWFSLLKPAVFLISSAVCSLKTFIIFIMNNH